MTVYRRETTNASTMEWPLRSTAVANWIVASILALVPFQGFLTVWGASLGVSYTALRMWNDVALIVLSLLCLVWFVRDGTLRDRLKNSYVALGITVFVCVQVVFMLRGVILGTVGTEAAIIGLALNARGPLFLLACVVLTRYSSWPLSRWFRITVCAAVIVAAFAVLQFTVLPKDFLTHFGYGSTTILPYETINSNQSYLRFASTTRGVNPLGAYMAIMIPLVIALWARLRPRLVWTLVVALMVGALVVSFSRSAWIGCTVSLLFLFGLRLKTRRDWLRTGGIVAGSLLIVGAIVTALPNNNFLQNLFLHTDSDSTIREDSNDVRYQSFFQTLHEVAHEPLGRGVGSAGPASVHNTKAEPRMAENYFLQITQETGWFGLFAYLAMLGIVGLQLWRLRERRMIVGLLAGFIGVAIINMLSYAWTDDTLAFTWYGLAGLALGVWVWREQEKPATIKG